VSAFADDFTAEEKGGDDSTGHRVIAGLSGVSKMFGGTIAVDDVSFDLRSGEILALLGENGAGKSTCVKLLAGVYRPDRGHVFVEGRPVDLHSPLEAHRHAIAVMHQHPAYLIIFRSPKTFLWATCAEIVGAGWITQR